MNPRTQNGRVVNGLMRSLVGLALLLIGAYVSDRGVGRAEAANLFSIGGGTLNWSAAGSWSNVACGGAAGGGPPTANSSVTICNGTTVLVNAAAAAAVVSIQAGATLQGGTGMTLSIGNTTNVANTAFTLNGGTFTPQTGTVRFFRNAATTLVGGTSAAITFNNLQIVPQLNAARTYTLAGGSIATMTVNGDFTVASTDGTAGTARTLTVNDGTLTALTVIGNMALNSAGNDPLVFNLTGGIPATFGRLNVSGSGSAANTFVAGTSTVTLNATSGQLIARGTNGVFSAGTSTVVLNSTASINSAIVGTFLTTNAFNILTVNMAAGITATVRADITANTALNVIGGILDTGGNAITGDGTGNLSVAAGANFTMSGTSVFPTLFSVYTFQPTSTVRYLQTNNQTVSARTYGNLMVAPTAASPVVHTFAATTVTIAGNLTIGNGTDTGLVTAATNSTTLDVAGAVSVAANSTLTAHATNPFLVAGNWVNAGTFTANGGTVTLVGTNPQNLIGETTFNNLTSTNTNAAGVVMASTQTVSGTLTLGANPFGVGANLLNLDGPTIAGTATSLSATGVSSLTFGGSTAGVNLPSNITALNNLTVNNTTATTQTALTLNSNVSVVGVLTLTNGIVSTGTNTLTSTSACTVSVVSAGTGWVSGNLQMRFPAGPPTCIFPVGDPAAAVRNYGPIQLAFTAMTTPGSLTASVLNEAHRNTTAGTSGIDVLKGINRYWSLKNSTVAGTYTATYTYVAGDATAGTPANYRVRRGASCSGTGVSRTCTPWGALAIPSPAATSTTATVAGITVSADSPAQADFAIGELDTSTNFLREKQFIYTRELY